MRGCVFVLFLFFGGGVSHNKLTHRDRGVVFVKDISQTQRLYLCCSSAQKLILEEGQKLTTAPVN